MKHLDYLKLFIGLANEGGGGITPSGTINITENGTYNVTQKASAAVAVPPYGEGSVNLNTNGTHDVSGKASAVVAVPPYGEGSVNIGTNGTHDVSGKASAVVAVQPNLQSKSVTIQQNGTTSVTPDQGKDGLSGVEITVNVSGGGGSANDWAYAFISGGYNGVLTDSTDPTVPRITRVIAGAMESETGLTGIDLRNCTVIESNAFNGCSNLESVNLPICTEIKNAAIQDCGAIKTFNAPLCATFGSSAMGQMWKLESINLNAAETLGNNAIVGVQPNAGSGKNTTLKLVELPALKTANGNFASFQGMTAMRLGSAVTTLNGNFGRYNTMLDTVIFGQNLAAVPTMGNRYVFDGTPIRTGTGYVYVPDALEADWKAATLWSAIAAHIKPLSAILTWTAGTYNKPDVVKHNGHYYRCDADGTTGEPGVDTTNWQDIGEIY